MTYPVNIVGNAWALLAESEMDEVLASAYRQRTVTLVTTAISMVIVGLCGWLISKAFSEPLDMVVLALTKVSQQDYDLILPDLNRKDEIGDLSRGLTLVADRLREFHDRLEQEKDQAKRDYVQSLWDYWKSYYRIRELTLFDFTLNQHITH